MKRYVAAIDQGTTSTRMILFDRGGNKITSHQVEHRQIFPKPGWVEHDPLEIWQRTQEVIKKVLTEVSISAQEIAAIGITNQRETTVVWDKTTGRPYGNAIVWQDTRTKEMIEERTANGGLYCYAEKTGLPLATYFSGPKIRWMLDHNPALRKDAESGKAIFGNMDTWLIWWLTGGPDGGRHRTDVTNASRSLLMDLATLSWDEELLSDFGIPRSMLPEICSSSYPEGFGITRSDGPFGATIPISGDLGDQQAALFGQTCFEVGEAKSTYGTGSFLLMNTGETPIHSSHGLISTPAYRIGKEKAVYALEGSIALAGSLVQWFRDNLGLIASAPEIEILAKSVSDNGGVYFVPAFSGLFAPYWRSDARGAIVGLTHFANKAHLARAVLEATAFQVREIFDAMQEDSGLLLKDLKVDGGMTVNELLMAFQADLLGVPVIRPKVTETTALGAAYAAGLAVGFWKDFEDLKSNWQEDKQWQARMNETKRERQIHFWKKAVQRTMGWVEL